MTELLLPRLKREIEARLAELRPFVEEAEQLEAAKAALLASAEGPARGAAPRERAARTTRGRRRREGDGGAQRAPRGSNREAILRLVEERPGVSVAEIAAVTKIAKPTVASTVSKLKREGVLADEAGGVKLASRQPITLASAFATLGGAPMGTRPPAPAAAGQDGRAAADGGAARDGDAGEA
mgnify:CR=1 FL=1